MAYIIEKQTGGEWRDAHEYLACSDLGRASAELLAYAERARLDGLSFTEIRERLRIREDCNGWSNRETCAVAAHIDDTLDWRDHGLSLARSAMESWGLPEDQGGPALPPDSVPADERGRQAENWVISKAADNVQAWFEGAQQLAMQAATKSRAERVTADVTSMLQDVGSFDRVEWREVARHLIGKVREIDAA